MAFAGWNVLFWIAGNCETIVARASPEQCLLVGCGFESTATQVKYCKAFATILYLHNVEES